MANELTVSGFAELDKLLKELPVKIEKNIMRGALRAGQKEFLDIARETVPVYDGDLRDSLRIKTSVRNGTASATLVAGNKKVYYAHMVEFGTTQHFIRPKGKKSLFFSGLAKNIVDHPGAKAKPFMRPAFDAGQAAAVAATADYIRKRLAKEAEKK